VAFSFAAQPLPPALRLLPASGVVPPKSHVLVALRFSPPDSRSRVSLELPVVFNHSPSDTSRLAVTGAAHEPLLTTSLAPGNRLFLRPTCVGTASARSVEVVNAGRVAAGWRWVVSRRLGGVVRIEPEVGGAAAEGCH
jgi:hypothetical protein